MSGYALRSVGTQTNGSSGTLSALMPAGWQVGDLLLIKANDRNNADIPATPSGYTLLSPQVNVTWSAVYGRIAQAGDTAPNVVWNAGHQSIVQMAAFSGNVWPSLSTIVAASVDANGTNNDMLYSALTVGQNNCLCIAVSAHNKTTTSDGASVNALTGFTQIDQQTVAGPSMSSYWGYVQQTTATNLSALTQTRTGTAESLQYTTLYLALKSAASGTGAVFSYYRQNIKG